MMGWRSLPWNLLFNNVGLVYGEALSAGRDQRRAQLGAMLWWAFSYEVLNAVLPIDQATLLLALRGLWKPNGSTGEIAAAGDLPV
jgi:hypothetical protein